MPSWRRGVIKFDVFDFDNEIYEMFTPNDHRLQLIPQPFALGINHVLCTRKSLSVLYICNLYSMKILPRYLIEHPLQQLFLPAYCGCKRRIDWFLQRDRWCIIPVLRKTTAPRKFWNRYYILHMATPKPTTIYWTCKLFSIVWPLLL